MNRSWPLKRTILPLLLLLGGCGYPLRTEPFLNGQLEVKLTRCPAKGPCDLQPITLTLEATNVTPEHYSFSGTLESDVGVWTIEGTETTQSRDDVLYINPQARGVYGTVTGSLEIPSGGTYALEGSILYGRGGGGSTVRLPPSETLFASPDPPCTAEACPYRELKIGIPEQSAPEA